VNGDELLRQNGGSPGTLELLRQGVLSIVTSAASISSNTWYHVVATYDSSSHNANIYINGTPSSGSGTATFTFSSDFYLDAGASNSTIVTVDEGRYSNIIRSADWIKTEYLNQNSPGTYETFGSQQTPQSATQTLNWYSASWTNRRLITIDHTKVSTASGTVLSNFPMLFSTTDPEFKLVANGGKVASSTGGDILFTDSDGLTKLNYEREYYSSTTGQLIAWVQIPTLSPAFDHVLYMYYGNAAGGLADQQNKTAVWDSNYKGVYHYAVNGATYTKTDSTSNARNLTSGGAPSALAGQIGGGVNYSGSSDYDQMASDVAVTGIDYTVSSWFKYPQPVTGSWNTLFRSSVGDHEVIIQESNNHLGLYYQGTGFNDSGFVMTTLSTGWHYLVSEGSNSANNTTFYMDGVLVGTVIGRKLTDPFTYIGNYQGGTQQWGQADEVRVSSGVSRSPDWIATEYANQNTPQYFYTLSGSALQNRSAGVPLLKSRGGVKFH
jgi:hypothetical protein